MNKIPNQLDKDDQVRMPAGIYVVVRVDPCPELGPRWFTVHMVPENGGPEYKARLGGFVVPEDYPFEIVEAT